MGIEAAGLKKSELATRKIAFGRVLDPSPLIALDGDLSATEAAIAASKAEFERTQKLLAAGENTSRKTFEAAEAQFRADEIKADSLHRQAIVTWGAALPMERAKRRDFVEALVRGECALVRVDLLPGDAIVEELRAAHLIVLGHEQQSIKTTIISPASATDARTQAQGFILLVEKPPFALRPGMALTAWIELAEDAHAGFFLPRSAVLRHDGQAWVYVREEEGKFVRKPVNLGSPLENGWFIEGEHGGLEGDEHVVVSGAQMLLSQEMKASAGSAEEE